MPEATLGGGSKSNTLRSKCSVASYPEDEEGVAAAGAGETQRQTDARAGTQ
jgi:hypothetical protein